MSFFLLVPNNRELAWSDCHKKGLNFLIWEFSIWVEIQIHCIFGFFHLGIYDAEIIEVSRVNDLLCFCALLTENIFYEEELRQYNNCVVFPCCVLSHKNIWFPFFMKSFSFRKLKPYDMKHHHPSIPKECWCHRDLFRLLSHHHHHHHPQQQTEQARAWYYC